LPETSLLHAYCDAGAYADCYALDVGGAVTLARYVTAFYTSAVFRPERWLLSLVLRMPSTDEEAMRLGEGTTDRFAAWTVEARDVDQIMLCDYQARTRSWLMVAPLPGGGTRLYFGTAVTTIDKTRTGRALARTTFHALLWFHKLYARALIGGAARRLG
jgi:hypothetical protein